MEVNQGQVFNLWDTNGRRNDVLNALKIYIEVLIELKNTYPSEKWQSYPDSLAQFYFYEKAVEVSKDVFKTHKNYDKFLKNIKDSKKQFLSKDKTWINSMQGSALFESLDKDIEQRARHYTSNLVKIGFADEFRNITNAGYAYIDGNIVRDKIEELLPINNTNLVIFRQMMKLRIYSNPDKNGNRKYYSPFFMALFLLLNGNCMDTLDFITIIQGINPYLEDSIKETIKSNDINIDKLLKVVQNEEFDIPVEFYSNSKLDYTTFSKHIKNRKSSISATQVYYQFYDILFSFIESKDEKNYERLLKIVKDKNDLLRKAFGYGKAIFDFGRGYTYDLSTFLEKNLDNTLYSNLINKELYEAYYLSKKIDIIREYSDTSERLLGATGLFKFKPATHLSYEEVLSEIFNNTILRNNIFGSVNNTEYENFEKSDGIFKDNCTLIEILKLSRYEVTNIINAIESNLGVSNTKEIQQTLESKVDNDFKKHIEKNYPCEKIIDILHMLSDRNNDSKIRKIVNDTATIPTIYEYIVAIAWYYVSGKNFSVYKSLNLTLNADFEPVVHAGGGVGDIVIEYDKSIVMLEVTLMNKQAQKRGEWEPVLRHSLNLKADNVNKETITFFIADELDYNTINIWRAVAAVPLESTSKHLQVDGVIIMPFTNREIITFLEQKTTSCKIIDKVKQSFNNIPKLTDTKWRDKILQQL
jgi:hypothetical protein